MCTVGIWVEVRRCEILIRELSPVLKLILTDVGKHRGVGEGAISHAVMAFVKRCLYFVLPHCLVNQLWQPCLGEGVGLFLQRCSEMSLLE